MFYVLMAAVISVLVVVGSILSMSGQCQREEEAQRPGRVRAAY